MKERYVTTTLYLEYNGECIELQFSDTVDYHKYFALSRTLFKSLFKFQHFFNSEQTIFLLRETSLIPNKFISDLTFASFKNFLLNINTPLYKEIKRLKFKNNGEVVDQLNFIDHLYTIDSRYKHISAKQYSSHLNAKLRQQTAT